MNTSESWPTDPRECHDLLNRFAQHVEDLQAGLDQACGRFMIKPPKNTNKSSMTCVGKSSCSAATSLVHGGNG